MDPQLVNTSINAMEESLSSLKLINPSQLSRRDKSRLNILYENFVYLINSWEIQDKNVYPEENIDVALWTGNSLMQYLFQDYITYAKGPSGVCLFCTLCEVRFDSNFLFHHLNDKQHVCAFFSLHNRISNGIWKQQFLFKVAFEKFIDYRADDTLYCKICAASMPFNHFNLMEHLESKKHITNFSSMVQFKSNSACSTAGKNFEPKTATIPPLMANLPSSSFTSSKCKGKPTSGIYVKDNYSPKKFTRELQNHRGKKNFHSSNDSLNLKTKNFHSSSGSLNLKTTKEKFKFPDSELKSSSSSVEDLSKDKEFQSKKSELMKHLKLVSKKMLSNTSECINLVKKIRTLGFYCYPCNFWSMVCNERDCHLESESHVSNLGSESSYEIFDCLCLSKIVCDNHFFLDHVASDEHKIILALWEQSRQFVNENSSFLGDNYDESEPGSLCASGSSRFCNRNDGQYDPFDLIQHKRDRSFGSIESFQSIVSDASTVSIESYSRGRTRAIDRNKHQRDKSIDTVSTVSVESHSRRRSRAYNKGHKFEGRRGARNHSARNKSEEGSRKSREFLEKEELFFWFGLTDLSPEVKAEDIKEAFKHFGEDIYVHYIEPNVCNIRVKMREELKNNMKDIVDGGISIPLKGNEYKIKHKIVVEVSFPPEVENNFNKTNCNAYFDSLLSNVTKEAETRMYHGGEYKLCAKIVEDDIKNSFQRLMNVRKVITIGSRATGVALKDSLLDIYIDIDDGYDFKDNVVNKNVLINRLEEIENCMKIIVPPTFENIRIERKYLYADHMLTKLKCKIFCGSGLVVENTELIRSYVTADEKIKLLIIIIKEWSKFTDIQRVSNYGITWMVLYYLMQSFVKCIKPVIVFKTNFKEPLKSLEGWDCGYAKSLDPPSIVCPGLKKKTIHQLLIGFFKFYASARFYNVLCPLTGEMFARKKFSKLELPSAPFEKYIQLVNNHPSYSNKLKLTSVIFQDPLRLNKNLTLKLDQSAQFKFKLQCEKMVKILFSK